MYVILSLRLSVRQSFIYRHGTHRIPLPENESCPALPRFSIFFPSPRFLAVSPQKEPLRRREEGEDDLISLIPRPRALSFHLFPFPCPKMRALSSQLRIANAALSILSPSFTFENNIFDIKHKRSEDYYSLLVSRKAHHPNITFKLQREFDFTIGQINQQGPLA